jgi:Na+-transporting NADH:ubiquinone oxidoreductase subunit NqrD
MTQSPKTVLLNPLFNDNPIALQMLRWSCAWR